MSVISYLEKLKPSPKKLPLLLGGAILLNYSVAHRAMPDNLSLGEGIWLIFVAVSGGIIMMWLAVYAAKGCCIMDLIRKILIRSIPSENESQSMRNIRFTFKEHIPPFNGVIYFTPVFWGFICFLLYFSGKSDSPVEKKGKV